MEDRALLLDFARTGSAQAFATLVERHLDLVYSAALRRVGGDEHRAREVSQQVFVDLARKARQVAHHPVLPGWLHQSTRWAVANLRRTEFRRARAEQAAAELATSQAGTEAANWDPLHPLLDAALDELRQSDREAVLLRFFSNLSYSEIGVRSAPAKMPPGCASNAHSIACRRFWRSAASPRPPRLSAW